MELSYIVSIAGACELLHRIDSCLKILQWRAITVFIGMSRVKLEHLLSKHSIWMVIKMLFNIMKGLLTPKFRDNHPMCDFQITRKMLLRFLEYAAINTSTYTVYPKKYSHGFCFVVLCCGYTLTNFPISIRLTSLALWQSNDCPSASKVTLMNMD